ncbi:amidase [Ideonella sp. A 288]|uniref:amidase n=1 Tax=Ideonella sp. A 288 TaxID=1962181 RepID=UPI000B4BDBDE|nr:amidase [Ideonella sp. A 288]
MSAAPIDVARAEAPAFDIDDRVGAWVPHGRFIVPGAPSGPLAGLRFAAKDLFDVAGHVTGAGNPTWQATHGPAAATNPTVQTLLDAGATLAGKVITDELAYSLHGDNHHHGAPLNRRAIDRVTGGSSSGSAAAAAARLVDFALGTDTGGSTRVPASYCGLWGLRTTHDLLPRAGLVPLSPSYDTVTWLADDGEVFERVADVLLPPSGWQPVHLLCPADAWQLAEAPFQAPLAAALAHLSALVGTSPQRSEVAAGDALERWRTVYATHSAREAWLAHGDWITRHRPTFGPAIAGRFAIASGIDAETSARADAEVRAIRGRVRAWLGADGVALLPSAASLAPRRDADPAQVDAVRLRTMAITCVAGLAGLPQVSLPWPGASEAPIGLSLLGPAGSDRALVSLARRLWQRLA